MLQLKKNWDKYLKLNDSNLSIEHNANFRTVWNLKYLKLERILINKSVLTL
jgi:hypothetical protein